MPSRFKSPIKADKADRRIIIREGELKDSRLDLLIDLGMPDLDDRVSIQWAGQYFDPKFKGYFIELFGVEADKAELRQKETEDEDSVYLLPDSGPTTPHHVVLVITDAKPGQFTFKEYIVFYVWLCRVRGPKRQIISEEIWHPKNGWAQLARVTLTEDAQTLLQFIEGAKPTRGGRNNVKVADQPRRVLRNLGSKHKELDEKLKKLISKARKHYKDNKNTWRDKLVIDYPILQDYPDILGKIDQSCFGAPSDSDASERALQRWEYTWEIAARLSIPNYSPFDTTAGTLRNHAICPKSK